MVDVNMQSGSDKEKIGKVLYEFGGTKFALNVRQTESCVVKLSVDGKESETALDKSDGKVMAFIKDDLVNGNHKIIIKVESGKLCIDSFMSG